MRFEVLRKRTGGDSAGSVLCSLAIVRLRQRLYVCAGGNAVYSRVGCNMVAADAALTLFPDLYLHPFLRGVRVTEGLASAV